MGIQSGLLHTRKSTVLTIGKVMIGGKLMLRRILNDRSFHINVKVYGKDYLMPSPDRIGSTNFYFDCTRVSTVNQVR